MKPDAARADRLQAVREAAGNWFRSGWIDEVALRQIEAAYPDDRVRVGITFRILFFILTVCALQGVMASFYVTAGSSLASGLLALIGGAVCACVTEHMIGPLKRRQGGIEAAFSISAVVQLIVAMVLLSHEARWGSFEARLTVDLLWAALICLAAAWRWGYWAYSVLAALLFFIGSGFLPLGRVVWILLPIALYPWLSAGCESQQLPPALRKCSAAFLSVCILAFYAAGNVYSLDRHLIELDLYSARSAPGSSLRWLSIIFTAVVPVVVVGLGIRTRRRLFLNLGLLLGVASLVTLRQYYHLAPPWLTLAAGGLALIAIAGLTKRLLDSGKNGERAGFTAGLLLEDPKKRRALEVLASVAVLSPEAQRPSAKPEFQGGGGKFGGGGASGDF